jgi:hypothetical protein
MHPREYEVMAALEQGHWWYRALLQGRHYLVFPGLHQPVPPAWNAPSRRGSTPSQTLSTASLGR